MRRTVQASGHQLNQTLVWDAGLRRMPLPKGAPTPEQIDSSRVGRPGVQTKVIVEQRSFERLSQLVQDRIQVAQLA